MKARAIFCICISLVAVLLGACTSSPPDKELQSGFLTDYSQLRRQECPGGQGNCWNWIDPRLNPQNYDAVIVESLQFFPPPKPTAEVSQETLDRLQKFVDTRFREIISQRVRIVEVPGPGVVRFRWALTAVGSESENLAPYQYIPAALVITGAKVAVQGGLPQDARVAFEIEATDSMTKQVLGLQLRTGTGERLDSYRAGERKVDQEKLMKLFEAWAQGMAERATNYIKAK